MEWSLPLKSWLFSRIEMSVLLLLLSDAKDIRPVKIWGTYIERLSFKTGGGKKLRFIWPRLSWKPPLKWRCARWYWMVFIVKMYETLVFTLRCSIVQSAVLQLHVICPSVCSSVRLSVTLVDHDHIGWKSWKLIAHTISPTSSLFVAQRSSAYSQGNMEKFWGNEK